MATYFGTTIYLKNNIEAWDALRALGAAVTSIGIRLQTKPYVQNDFLLDYIENSATFHRMEQHYQFLSIHSEDVAFPAGTPAEYTTTQIEEVNIKGVNLVKVYLPVLNANDDVVSDFIWHLFHVAYKIFGDNLVNMQAKRCVGDETFEDSDVNVVLSTKRFRTA